MAGHAGASLQSGSLLEGFVPEDREASLLKRLARPRETDEAASEREAAARKGKGGTYRQQQLREELRIHK